MPRDPRTWLYDIVQAGERLARFLSDKNWDDYQGDELLRAGVERQFEIIGESLGQLRRHSPELAGRVREHEKIIGFRNVLIHGYAVVDDAIVGSVATEKLPTLLADVRTVLDDLTGPD